LIAASLDLYTLYTSSILPVILPAVILPVAACGRQVEEGGMSNDRGVLTRLCDLTEQGLASLAGLLFSSRGVTDTVVKGAETMAGVKGHFDRAMRALLGILSLPSKTDYNRLLAKVEVLQGNLVNLNIKVDRLLAIREHGRRESPTVQGGTGEVPEPNPG
jgi:hypothetical protein